VWYRYTAASTSPVVISTLGSDFDTMIAVYAGTTLSGLSAVVCNDQFNGTGEARVTWTPLVGVTYEIQVGGFYDSAGDLVLQLINPPANDNFVNAQVLSLPGAVTGSNAGASMEVGEPIPNCGGTGTSVWFRLVPTSSGGLTATTAGSTFDTTLALYSGTSLGTLTQLACNDDSMGTQQSQLVVNVSAGSTYYLRLAGYAGEAGAYTLTTSLGDALPRTATPTSSTSVGSTLRGKVMLQGPPAPPSNALAVPLLVQFFQAPDSTPVRVAFPILDNMGNFTVEGVLPGTYTVRVKHAESLSVEVLALDLSAPLTYDFGLLPMGDGDNNDQVDIIDFSVLRAAFGRTVSCGVGPSATVPCADFDGSGFVDIVDFSLLRANFGRAGPIRVTPAVGAPALTVLPAATQSFTATMTVNTSLTAVNQLSPTPVITPPPTRSATTTPSATPSRGLPALTPSPSRI